VAHHYRAPQNYRAPQHRTHRVRSAVRPYHGVFVYGPRPTHHDHYQSNPVSNSSQVQKAHLPKRRVDRDDTFAVGLRAGSIYGAYEDADGYADVGLGLTARYRPEEFLGLEVALSHHDQTFEEDSERLQTVAQASAMLFATPWNRVSPYVLAGVTTTSRDINDDRLAGDNVVNLTTAESLWGLHGGAGFEFALGDTVALDLEARYISYANMSSQEPSMPGAFQTTAGILMHF